MKYLTGAQIRQMWIDFFVSKGHMVEAGAPLVPVNDATLLWINSGVAALKKYFDGREKPASPRIVNAQKSIRTNDIDNVGYTARHHTFFEMLGNFSIGDYFRKEALVWAMELLTKPEWFAFSLDKLYFTVHPTDLVARQMWIDLGVDPTHIIDVEGNFWQIGEGPCGPNTEIFVDRGEKYDPRGLGVRLLAEDIENDRYIEIWNIVFSQYNAKDGLSREQYPELPQKNIDTGAGLERIACVLQEVETNYETDLFMPMIQQVQSLTGVSYTGEAKKAYRVIADHIRSCTFAIADGAVFSNEGRGYVLRRILRRAVRYGRKLGLQKPFLYTLVPTVATIMHDYYPYLQGKLEFVQKLIKAEEERFLSTLHSGEQMLFDALEQHPDRLSGEVAFKLYDTYGFPFELTLEIAQERGVRVDKEGFTAEMAKQKERARAARQDDQSMHSQSEDLLKFDTPSTFIYDGQPMTATITAIFDRGIQVDAFDGLCQVALDQTIFYAESGGQVADTGTMSSVKGTFQVVDVQKAPQKQHLHLVEGTFAVGDRVELSIDIARRQRIARHHSAAHLLNQALHDVLGEHVNQAGSYVDDQRMRFDFTHYEKISPETLKRIERIVNEKIDAALPTVITEMPIAQAKALGARALFTEKYGAVVRVVSIGGSYSVELCGGTHVDNSERIGNFVIEFEESISSGVRRIQAIAGHRAYEAWNSSQDLLHTLATELGVSNPSELVDRWHALKSMNDAMKAEWLQLKDQMAQAKVRELLMGIDPQQPVVLVKDLKTTPKEEASKMLDALKGQLNSYAVFFVGVDSDKLYFMAAYSADRLAQGAHAGKFIKEVAALCQGNGGGRPELAQGGSKDVASKDAVLTYALTHLGGKKA